MNRLFSKEDIKMAKTLRKRCSTSLIIREMQIKTTVRYHLSSVRRTIIKNSTNNMLARKLRKVNPCTLLLGPQIGIVSMENCISYYLTSYVKDH